MATCPTCGAPVQHGQTLDGERVVLDTFEEPSGPDRFVVLAVDPDSSPTLVVERVAQNSPRPAHPDHRKDCPGHGNGR